MTITNTEAGTLLLSYRPAPYCPAPDKTSRRYACETNLDNLLVLIRLRTLPISLVPIRL